MEIAFCTDTNYVMPCGVAMTSICENNKEEDITFHLVITDEGTAPDEVEKKVSPLRDIAVKYGKIVEVYRMDAEKIKGFTCSGAGYISTTAFARIFLPEILPDEVKKVIYLDCDVVCDGSLKDLWETELIDDFPLGAIVDCYYAAPMHHKISEIPQEVHYINSGVLLMNLASWRKYNYVEKVILVATEKRFPLLDQDTLNHVFSGKIKYLPVKFNVQTIFLMHGIENNHISLDYYDEIKEACDAPILIHYVTPNKPWKNEFCPLREIWEKYLKLTVWKDLKPSPVLTRFDRTYLNKEFQDTYWMDGLLFNEGLAPYLRFFRAAVRLKNKSRLVKISSSFLNGFAAFLEKVYSWKSNRK